MTNDEALSKIAKLKFNNYWHSEGLKILDDIDKGPQEFTVRELGELVAANEDVLRVEIYSKHSWTIVGCDDSERFGAQPSVLRRELMTPPPLGKSVAELCSLRLDVANYIATSTAAQNKLIEMIDAALEAAQ